MILSKHRAPTIDSQVTSLVKSSSFVFRQQHAHPWDKTTKQWRSLGPPSLARIVARRECSSQWPPTPWSRRRARRTGCRRLPAGRRSGARTSHRQCVPLPCKPAHRCADLWVLVWCIRGCACTCVGACAREIRGETDCVGAQMALAKPS
jgi:hypothetical protein